MTNPLTLIGAVGIGDGTQTSAGTTQATATTCVADHVSLDTVASGTGVILKPANGGEAFSVANCAAANDLLVYPPVGVSINGSTANTALTLTAKRAAFFVFVSPTKINAIY